MVISREQRRILSVLSKCNKIKSHQLKDKLELTTLEQISCLHKDLDQLQGLGLIQSTTSAVRYNGITLTAEQCVKLRDKIWPIREVNISVDGRRHITAHYGNLSVKPSKR